MALANRNVSAVNMQYTPLMVLIHVRAIGTSTVRGSGGGTGIRRAAAVGMTVLQAWLLDARVINVRFR